MQGTDTTNITTNMRDANFITLTLDSIRTDLSTKMSDIYDAISFINKQLAESKIQIRELQQQSNDVIINGVPCQKGENLLQIFRNICKAIDFDCHYNELNNLFRLGKKGLIVVKFCSTFAKNGFLQKFFDCTELTQSDLGFDSTNHIYIKSFVIPTYREIYKDEDITMENVSISLFVSVDLSLKWTKSIILIPVVV